jgi:hypothetical protein
VRMACVTASVPYRHALTEDELVHALLSGKVPRNRGPHVRRLLEEAPRALLDGLTVQVDGWTRPGKVENNLARLAQALNITR